MKVKLPWRLAPVLALFVVAAILAGCASGVPKSVVRHYVPWTLSPSPPGDEGASVPVTASSSTLLVAPASVAAFYDTTAIVYSTSAGSRGQYQLHAWTEPPDRQLHRQIRQAIARTHRFASVALEGDGARGDVLLNTRLSEVYIAVVNGSASAVVSVEATMLDLRRGRVLMRETFSHRVPIGSDRPEDGIAGVRLALNAVVQDVAVWRPQVP